MSIPLPHFTLTNSLVGQIFQILESLPAKHSRAILNELERQCGEQERAAAMAEPETPASDAA